MDDVQNVPVLHLALDECEELPAGDVVEVLRDILLEIVSRALGVGVDVFTDLHGACVRPFVLLRGIRVTDARPQQDGPDDLEDGMLDDPVGICDGIAEMPLLPALEYVA